jgi:selenocysteine lyase/cysteine desulfurase
MHRGGRPLASGTIRASLVHYNTVAEIHRFGDVLSGLTG